MYEECNKDDETDRKVKQKDGSKIVERKICEPGMLANIIVKCSKHLHSGDPG